MTLTQKTSHPLTLTPFLEGLTIQDRDTGQYIAYDPTAPFSWAQMELIHEVERQYNARKPVRIIVLKARQIGISTISAGLVFLWSFIRKGTTGLIIAHESDISQSLFEKTQINWENWPFAPLYTPKNMSMSRMTWAETRSSIKIASAKNVKSGRGRTIHILHGSECAYWDEAETLMVGLNQTIPRSHGTIVIMESTANGVGGWFYDEWQKAEAGESDFTPLFFPWYRHYEYSLPATTVDERHLDRTEKYLLRLGATLDNLEWRRWAVKNLCHSDEDYFKQEYPATPEEAFLTSGTNVFQPYHLQECYERKRGAVGEVILTPSGRYEFRESPSGPFTMFRSPSTDRSWGQYVVAGDPTHTTMGDRACIQVLSARTFEQVGVWHGHIDPIGFADELMKLAYFYNTALLNTEVDGPGYATVGRLTAVGYPRLWQHRWADKAPGKISQVNLGWLSNYQRKHWAIGMVKWMLTEKSLLLHDPETYKQMLDYSVLNEVGAMGNGNPHGFDDAVMALAIGVVTAMTDRAADYELDPSRNVRMSVNGKIAIMGEKVVPGDSTDYFGIPPWDAFTDPDEHAV